MKIELKEEMRVEALANLLEKQRDFFRDHPGARLSVVPSSGGYLVVIEDRCGQRFEGRASSYEDALSRVLGEAWCSSVRARLAVS